MTNALIQNDLLYRLRRTQDTGPDSGVDVPMNYPSSRYNPQVFYVNNSLTNASSGNDGRSPDRPLTTLTQALALCTAGRGDFIIVGPGHVETIASASALTISKSNVSIIGVGNGALRPTLTWATLTTATCLISGNNVLIQNILCTSTVAALVKLFSITGADCTLDKVDYQEDGATDALQFALTTATGDRLKITNCRWFRGVTAASATSVWIGLVGSDGCVITDNFLILKSTANNADGAIVGATTASLNVEIARNKFYHVGSNAAVSISMFSGSTGFISDNRIGTSKTATAGSIAPASCFCQENYVSNEVAKSGFLEPAADSN